MLHDTTNLPSCNFIWVGSPCDRETLQKLNRSRALIGHDTWEVINISKQIKNPVNYWCLDEYAAHYRKVFKDAKAENIKVCSIEQFLKECSESTDEFTKSGANFLLRIKNQLFAEGRGKIRDLVTFKAVFAFYLLAAKLSTQTEPKYTLDTNNEIAKQMQFLPVFPKFHAPFCFIDKQPLFECWAMYSPANDETARRIFWYFTQEWHNVEDEFKYNTYSKAYHRRVGRLLINSIAFGKSSDFKKPTPDELKWEYQAKKRDIMEVKALGIQKTYSNTHKDEGMIFDQWKSNLEEDNVDYFKNRYFNDDDLRSILKMAQSLSSRKTSDCTIYLTKTLEESILNKIDPELVDKSEVEMTPSWVAAANGNGRVIDILREAKIDLNTADKDGWTPALFAAQNGHAGIIKALFSAKADLNQANNKGYTPAIMAAYKNQANVLETLLDCKVDINKQDNNNKTSLHYAIQQASLSAIMLLLNCGAITNIKDKLGHQPIDYANEQTKDFITLLSLKKYIETNPWEGQAPEMANKHLALIDALIETLKMDPEPKCSKVLKTIIEMANGQKTEDKSSLSSTASMGIFAKKSLESEQYLQLFTSEKLISELMLSNMRKTAPTLKYQ